MIDISIFKNISVTVFHTSGSLVANGCTRMQVVDQWLTPCSDVCMGSTRAGGFSSCGPCMIEPI